MTRAFAAFVEGSRARALKHGLDWTPPFDERGVISQGARWNVAALVGSRTPVWISTFGWNASMENAIRETLEAAGTEKDLQHVMAQPWRELLLAAAIDHTLVKKRAPHSVKRLERAIRILGLCAGSVHPVELTGDDVRFAYNVALRVGDTEAARTFPGVIRKLFDNQHLAIRPNLAACCQPFGNASARAAQARVDHSHARSNSKGYRAASPVLEQLHDRHDKMKLPDNEAFWEFCRIVFSEAPRSVHDLQLFAGGRLHIILGLRAVEIATMPDDCLHWCDWYDLEKKPAGESGGISRSLQVRYFGAKQNSEAKGPTGRWLVPKVIDVPPAFEDVVVRTIEEVRQANRPLRDTYAKQLASGRLLPDFDPDELVAYPLMYQRLFGTLQISTTRIPDNLLRRYREGKSDASFRWDPRALEPIYRHQRSMLGALGKGVGASGSKVREQARLDWKTARTKSGGLPLFRENGEALPHLPHIDWDRAFVRTRDVEAKLSSFPHAKAVHEPPSAVKDEAPIHPHEFLFLTCYKKRRDNEDTLDIGHYFAVRRFAECEVARAMGESKSHQHLSILGTYGRTPENRQLRLNSHSPRHLQNTELYRKGIADASIAARFNRTNAEHNAAYDHRSLAEKLAAIELPQERSAALKPSVAITYKLIVAGRVAGALVDAFKKIQSEEGDDAALDFLIAEADGFHSTPYGFCLNSFTVDPCPKHLQCFDGCRHLTRTDDPREQHALEQLRSRTSLASEEIERRPANTVGRANQLAHARGLVKNIDRALSARPGDHVFPEGADLSVPIGDGRTILDKRPPTFRARRE